MKKRQNLFLLSLSLLAVVLAGCSNDEKQIRAAAQGYLDAMGNYRPTDARPYATEETCNVTLAFFEKLMQHTDPSVYANNIPATITLGDVATYDDTLATVAFHKHTPSKEQDGKVTLVCRDGQWRVHQVIEIPDMLRDSESPRTFTPEQIEGMRRNGRQSR